MNRYKFLLLSIVFFTSCSGDNFYEYYQVDDLWRLPLSKPYELRNVAGVQKGFSVNDNWHIEFLKLKNNFKENSFKGLNVTHINVDKGIIYGFGNRFPCYHFLINLNSQEEKIFTSEANWKEELGGLCINSKNILDVFDVFEEFKSDNKLPWR